MGGRQRGFSLDQVPRKAVVAETRRSGSYTVPPRPRPLASRLSEAEASRHDAFVATLGAALWLKREDG